MVWFLIILGVLALASIAFVATRLRRRGLPVAVAARLRVAWQSIEAVQDSHRRIIDAEKILDEALGALGYGGGFGDKLKKAGPRFSDIDAVWRAHKLRNRLAHEVGATVEAAEERRALAALRRAFEDLS